MPATKVEDSSTRGLKYFFWLATMIARLTLILFFAVPLSATCAQQVSVGDRFTVRLKDPNGYGRPDVRAMAFSPDGSELAVSTKRDLQFIRTSDGELTTRLKQSPFSIVYSKDGNRFYSIGESGSKIFHCQGKSEIPINFRRIKGFVGIQVANKNGKIVVDSIAPGSPAAKSDLLSVGDEIVGIADGRTSKITSVVGEDIKRFAKRLSGPAGTELKLATIARGKIDESNILLERHSLGSTNGQTTFESYVPNDIDDSVLWCMSGGYHEFRSARDGSFITALSSQNLSNTRGSIGVSPDSKLFAWAGKYIEVPESARTLRKKTMLARRKASGDFDEGYEDGVAGAAMEEAGYDYDYEPTNFFGVEIRSINTRNLVATFPTALDVKSFDGSVFKGIEFDEENKHLVIATATQVHIYELETGNLLRQFTPCSGSEEVTNCMSVANGLVATGDWKGLVRVNSLETGELLQTIRCREKQGVTHIKLSPDAKRLAYHVDGVAHVVHLNKENK